MKHWCLAALLASAAAGCSGMSEDDPAYPYQDTRWLNEQGGAEIRMNDGKAKWIAYGDEREQFDLTYTVNDAGNIVFHDPEQKIFKQDLELAVRNGQLVGPMGMASWAPVNDELEARFMAKVEQREAANRLRTAPRPTSLEGYRPIPFDELADVLAARMEGEIPDENLAEVFIAGYSSNLDAFARRDLLEREMPKLKARLASLKDHHDYRIAVFSTPSMVGAVPAASATDAGEQFSFFDYDFDTKSFPVTGFFLPCHLHDNMAFGARKIRGAPFNIRAWGIKEDAACRMKPADEQVARRIEEARKTYKLRHHALVYFRVTGQKDASGALEIDVHRVDVTPYLEIRSGFGDRPGEFEQLGNAITMTAPAGGAK